MTCHDWNDDCSWSVSLFLFASGRNFFNLGWEAHQILSTWQGSKIHSCGHSDLKIDLCKCHCERHWVSWKLIEHVFVWKPRWEDVSKVRPARFSNTHRTNVWYVYLHLLQTSTKRGKIHHTPILCDMASWLLGALLVNEKNSGVCPEWLERSWKIHPRKLTWIPKIAIFSKGDTFSKPSFFGIYLRFQGGYTSKWPDPLHFTDRPPVCPNENLPCPGCQADRKRSRHRSDGENWGCHQPSKKDGGFPKMVVPNNHGCSY